MMRRATRADLPAIVALLADDTLGAGREDASLPLNAAYLSAFEAIERDENQFLAVAEQDGALLGCLHLTFLPGISRLGAWRGQVESVRVAAAARGSGLGRRMLEWAAETARARGCTLVQLTTDKTRPEAHRFYESLGYQPTHIGYKLPL
ncbi:N-acetyltransferase family protein [Ponticoccus sp. (in: a-proteobacteria)]|uniref:GNAT family N-acetyltransferase n=1 Tax=Ponticoccus sp. (in: a-proteobacteria) TaxID=1925025 RepID=UPI003AB8E5BF